MLKHSIYVYIKHICNKVKFIISFYFSKDLYNNINNNNNNNNNNIVIIIITTMKICTNPVRRRIKGVLILPSGVPFIGN